MANSRWLERGVQAEAKMVFVIQNTQNRDARAVHLKLDELIRAIAADDTVMGTEEDTDEEMAELKRHDQQLCDDHAAIKVRLAQALRPMASA